MTPTAMLDVAAARAIVLARAEPRPAVEIRLDALPPGCVLADDAATDIDSPPFPKALMDGYAVKAGDFQDGRADLRIVGEVQAGKVPTVAVGEGTTVRIFTGAPIPDGADAVVMVERTQLIAADAVRILDATMKSGQHILIRGAEMRAGDIVVPAGAVVTPAVVGLLAAAGRTRVAVRQSPGVSVVATGDELVEPHETPGPGQIRNSNGPMLAALAAGVGSRVTAHPIARDTEPDLLAVLAAALDSDPVVVIAGGVSAGAFDLVPKVLRDLDVDIHFHSVKMKPGKPLLFGTKGATLVFGLPGNPVSAFVGFALFVKPALRKLAGHADPGPAMVQRPLLADFAADNNRPTFHPARWSPAGVEALPWFGSADLRALLPANALLVLPAGPVKYRAGDTVTVIPL